MAFEDLPSVYEEVRRVGLARDVANRDDGRRSIESLLARSLLTLEITARPPPKIKTLVAT